MMITIVVTFIKKLQIIYMFPFYLSNLIPKSPLHKMFKLVVMASIVQCSAVLAQGSVWQVSKGNQKVFLAGTVHILPAEQFPLPKAYSQVYQLSDAIVLETPLPDSTDLAFQQKLLKAVSYEQGKTLKQFLSDETYQKLDRYLQEFQLNIGQFNQFKPGYIATVMTMLAAKKAKLAGMGVDAHFAERAKRDQKTIEYLETQAFQLSLIANMGNGNEEVFIKATLEQMQGFEEMFSELLPAWRNGDAALLNSLVVEPVKKDDPVNYDAVLTARNKQWLPIIEQMFLDQDTEMVLVGVGHLVGQDSVITLLKDKGYHVEKFQ